MRRIFKLINKNLFFSQLNILNKKNVFKKTDKKTCPLITISREMGAGGHPIAELVVEKLGNPWKLYHKQIIQQIAKKSRLERKLISEIDESKRPLIEEVIYDFFGKKYVNLSTYYKHLVKVIATIGKHGWFVVVGRGANFLCPEALKIRIVCDMEQRIKWEVEFEKISRKEAIRRIKTSDKTRYQFVKTLFNYDHRKAHHYDLVIRTSKDLSIHDATDIIVNLAKKKFNL